MVQILSFKELVQTDFFLQAQYLQDLAAERCSMPYRPPELFQVDSKFTIDERTDLWVCTMYQLPMYYLLLMSFIILIVELLPIIFFIIDFFFSHLVAFYMPLHFINPHMT